MLFKSAAVNVLRGGILKTNWTLRQIDPRGGSESEKLQWKRKATLGSLYF